MMIVAIAVAFFFGVILGTILVPGLCALAQTLDHRRQQREAREHRTTMTALNARHRRAQHAGRQIARDLCERALVDHNVRRMRQGK